MAAETARALLMQMVREAALTTLGVVRDEWALQGVGGAWRDREAVATRTLEDLARQLDEQPAADGVVERMLALLTIAAADPVDAAAHRAVLTADSGKQEPSDLLWWVGALLNELPGWLPWLWETPSRDVQALAQRVRQGLALKGITLERLGVLPPPPDTIDVLRISRIGGEEFLAPVNDGPALASALLRAPELRSVERVTMTAAEYFATPATNASAAFFREVPRG